MFGAEGADEGFDEVGLFGDSGAFASGSPDGDVDIGIADVVEAGAAEFGFEAGGFVGTGEIEAFAGGEDGVEDTEVGGDGLGEGAIGAGGEDEGSALGVLEFELSEEVLAVGEGGGVEAGAGGEVVLEAGASFEEPEREEEDDPPLAFEGGEEGFGEEVGVDEGAVEIDAEGHLLFDGQCFLHVRRPAGGRWFRFRRSGGRGRVRGRRRWSRRCR